MNVEALMKLEAAVMAGDIADVNRVLGKIFAADHSLPWERVSNVNSACRGSLDAAKALHEALLPDRPCEIAFGRECDATVTFLPTWNAMHLSVSDANPARAWLLAIIRALIAHAEKEGQE